MKKLFLLVAAAGLVTVTSCKKEREQAQDAVNQTAAGAEDLGNDVANGAKDLGNDVADGANKAFEDAKAYVTDAPEVENDQLQEWVNKLHDAAVKAKAASTAGDQEALNEAVAEMTSLNESLSSFSSDPEYGKAEAYYKEVQAELEQQ